MRILFVTGEFPPMQGGVGDCTNEIAKALAGLGVDAHVLTTAVNDSPSPISHPPIHIHRLVPKWNWNSISILRRTIRETHSAIVHIQYQTAAFGMHPAINLTPRALNFATVPPSPNRRGGRGDATKTLRGSRAGERLVASGVRFITTFHDLQVPYLFPKAGRVRDWITFELARSCDAVIATNADDRETLRRKVAKAIDLIPIGSNIAPAPPSNYDRAAWRAKLGIAADEILISYFGFLNESKGGTDLIRAFALVPHAKLIMIGGQVGASDPTNVSYLAQVKKLIEELGLTSRVLWTDYTDASIVSANLLASDLCVLPYRDGASFRRGSFMAALAHGLPIISTHPSPVRTGEGLGMGVALLDAENVLLVPTQNPMALAEAITRLAASPELRARLSQGARALAQNFTWNKIAAQHLDLYNRLLAK